MLSKNDLKFSSLLTTPFISSLFSLYVSLNIVLPKLFICEVTFQLLFSDMFLEM